jgi:probable rRNA maturation factor
VISADTARRQAREFGVSMRAECARLAIHGVLHLCGYDDRSENDRAAMRQREDRYLRQYVGFLRGE